MSRSRFPQSWFAHSTLYVLTAMALALAGCKVDQAKEVAIYRGVLDHEMVPATQPFAANEALSLEQALALTNAHNERLALQGEDYLQAVIDKSRAAAAFLPTVALAPSYTWRDAQVQPFTNYTLDVPIRTNTELFAGGSNLAGYRGSLANIRRQRHLLLDLQAQVLLDTASVYYQVLRSQRQVAVLENSLALQEERVRDAQTRQEFGVARPLDAAQALSQAAATRVLLVEARRDVQTGRSTLALLSAAPVRQSELVDGFETPGVLPAVAALEELALEQRQDLQAAAAALALAQQGVRAAVGRYYPSVSLNFDYFLSRESIPTESDWFAMLQVNLPIFTAGRIKADVRTAWSRLRQAALAQSYNRRVVLQQVQNDYQRLAANTRRIEELGVQLQAAQEALRLAEETYRAGLGTSLERLQEQDRLLSAQLQLASAEYDRKVMYLSLLRSIGIVTTLPQGQIPALTATQPATVSIALPALPSATQPTTQPTTPGLP